MMGERTVMQAALFYEFSLERHVPSDHLLRSFAQGAAPKGNLRTLKLAWSQGSSAPMAAACAC
ncbi:hypothetical protein J2847_005278 [Azospirillum agricola]|nr:hypothetical protein [Azospirillum agricola]